MITQVIWADVNNRELDNIYARVGDEEIREIQFIICRNDPPEKVEIPAGVSGQFRMIKSSGNFVVRDMAKTVQENGTVIFKVAISDQMVNVQGTGYYDIRLSGGGYLYTASGRFIVDTPVISSSVLEDVSEVNGLVFPDDFLTVEDHVAIIDDDTISTDSTWSSNKINEEIEAHAGGDVSKTVSGNPITFTDGADAPLVKCVTEIQGSQDLHGYDKPWVGGSGKNKFDSTLMVSPASSAKWVQVTLKANTTYTVSSDIPNSYTSAYIFAIAGTDTSSVTSGTNGVGQNRPQIITTGSDGIISFGYRTNGASGVLNLDDYVYQIEEGSTATTYEPYSNICPITAYTEGEIEVNDGDGNTTTHTTTYPSAIYRGSEDCVNGTAEIVKPCYLLSDFTWYYVAQQQRFYTTGVPFKASAARKGWVLSSAYEAITDGRAVENIPDCSIYTSGQSTGTLYIQDSRYSDPTDLVTNMGNTQICYELATPTTSSITPTNLPIKSLSGYTHIESSTGEMEVEYITERFQPLIDSIKQL